MFINAHDSIFVKICYSGIYLSTALIGLVWIIYSASGMLTIGDGQIAFESNRAGDWDIYLLDVRTSLIYNLTNYPGDDLQPTWSGQTDEIAFYSNREDPIASGIYAIDLSTRSIRLIKTDNTRNWRPSWSPTGEQIAFMRGYNEIKVVNIDTLHEYELTYGFSPTWSPVDARIVYYSDRPTDLQTDIYIINADGSHPRSLDQNRYSDWDPSWSPDGRQIAFISSRSGYPDVYIMDADCESSAVCESNATRLTFTSSEEMSPRWSPNGRQVVFVSKQNEFQHLYLINIDGTGQRPLTAGSNDNRFPAWKP